MRIPDLFIIGAPKSGTNALYDYLRTHPRIYMPQLKEPQYFCKDFPDLAQVPSFDAYLNLFADAPAQAKLGEASVWYLYSKLAVPEIMEVNPWAKFIVVLRNPIDLAHSLHAQFVRLLKEDVDDFEVAWNLQANRRQGCCLPPYCPEAACLQYKAVCSFSEQISHVKRHVPAGQLKVLLYEELFADTKREYEGILSFLGLPSDGRETFHVANDHRAVRSRIVLRMLRFGMRILPNRYRELRQLTHQLGIKPLRLVSRYNSMRVARPPMRPAFRAALAAEFAEEVARLESVLGRKIPCWGFAGRAAGASKSAVGSIVGRVAGSESSAGSEASR